MPVMPLPFPAQPIGSTPGSSIPIPIVSDEEREFREFARQFSEVSDELNEKTTQIQALLEKQNWLKHYMTFFGRPQRTTVEEDFGPEVAAEINDLEIRDPYALCFALLYLIETGDDLPWLYGPGIGLMLEVAESLPWGVYEYEEEDDQIWFPDEDYVPGPVKPSAIPDWYERRYLYRKGKEDAFPRSLAQIVYERTGCLMPRNMHLYDEAVKELNGYGIRGKDATGLLYCMLALTNSRHQDRAFNLDDMMQRILDTDMSASEETETRLSFDELSEKADRQKEEIQNLRRALHEAERNTRATNKELERLRAESQLEHRELADLRELVFLQNAPEEETEEDALEEGFPYEVRKDTLVFGGHATWCKAIKPMLTGNIRFLDKDKGFDSAIIRHTERVWIQTNALSHSQYYAIIDVIRQFKKPVRYFSFASATKCAIQLRQADQNT